jgi:hypothetical protein
MGTPSRAAGVADGMMPGRSLPGPAAEAASPPAWANPLFTARDAAAPAASPVCCLVVDAEEDFDWATPVQSTDHSVECMRRISDLLEVVGGYGIRPTYVLTYPVLQDSRVVSLLRRHFALGYCDLGIQLHPWVTPPYEEHAGYLVSYLSNLSPQTEAHKLQFLMAAFRDCFGFDPTIFRAGRYGLSPATTHLLEQHGFHIDTSIAPRTDFHREGGPDYIDYDCDPFWFGETRRLLEVPLCRSVVGWAGTLAPRLYRAATSAAAGARFAPAALGRLRVAERITLSPEGNDVAAMKRLLHYRRQAGQTVFTLSFHSSSLAPGRNPYVATRADLHHFYDRLSAVIQAMHGPFGFGFVSLAEIPALLRGGPA